ncbi:MAG: beta-galactosidase [Verrucomicrobia bacterium]|nr:beta-galactosidase [Verrucomicrobiota bacterium]
MKYGTAYYPDYFPESEWSQDLDRMVSCGVTSVRILEFGWCFYEPMPGVFVWDGVDRFLDLCLARKLAVCIATPTATPPPWFFQQFPRSKKNDAYDLPGKANADFLIKRKPALHGCALGITPSRRPPRPIVKVR